MLTFIKFEEVVSLEKSKSYKFIISFEEVIYYITLFPPYYSTLDHNK